jgi:hypothetical protein
MCCPINKSFIVDSQKHYNFAAGNAVTRIPLPGIAKADSTIHPPTTIPAASAAPAQDIAVNPIFGSSSGNCG